MTATRDWMPGDRVVLRPVGDDLLRLDGVRATVVCVDGATARIRFDSPKLLRGRLRVEIDVATAWLEEEPRRTFEPAPSGF